jgi:hypothetical protein
MEAKEIVVGNYYRAKKPKKLFDGGYDDRRILYISQGQREVQYDSPTVGNGRRYPTITMERFLKWVGKQITEADYLNTTPFKEGQ